MRRRKSRARPRDAQDANRAEWRLAQEVLRRAERKSGVRRDALRYCTLQTRSVPAVVPQSVPMGVALVIDNQVFD